MKKLLQRTILKTAFVKVITTVIRHGLSIRVRVKRRPWG